MLPSELTLHDKFEEILELTVSPVYESVVRFQHAKQEEEIARSFDPERTNHLRFRRWKLCESHLSVIMSALLGSREDVFAPDSCRATGEIEAAWPEKDREAGSMCLGQEGSI